MLLEPETMNSELRDFETVVNYGLLSVYLVEESVPFCDFRLPLRSC